MFFNLNRERRSFSSIVVGIVTGRMLFAIRKSISNVFEYSFRNCILGGKLKGRKLRNEKRTAVGENPDGFIC